MERYVEVGEEVEALCIRRKVQILSRRAAGPAQG